MKPTMILSNTKFSKVVFISKADIRSYSRMVESFQFCQPGETIIVFITSIDAILLSVGDGKNDK